MGDIPTFDGDIGDKVSYIVSSCVLSFSLQVWAQMKRSHAAVVYLFNQEQSLHFDCCSCPVVDVR